MYERSSIADTKVSAGEGQQGEAPSSGAEILLRPMVQPMVIQLCPCGYWLPERASSHLQPLKDSTLVQVNA